MLQLHSNINSPWIAKPMVLRVCADAPRLGRNGIHQAFLHRGDGTGGGDGVEAI